MRGAPPGARGPGKLTPRARRRTIPLLEEVLMGAPARWTAAAVLALGLAPASAAADGAGLYQAHCAACHGRAAAPKFVGRSVEDVKRAIAEGKGRMRPVALSREDADAIAEFVASPGPVPSAVPPSSGRNPAAKEKIASGDRAAAAGDDKRALDAYLEAVNLDSLDVEARLKLAAQYQRMGHPGRAAQQWELALALQPGNEEAARRLREAQPPGR